MIFITKLVFICYFIVGIWEEIKSYLLSKSSPFHIGFLIGSSTLSHTDSDQPPAFSISSVTYRPSTLAHADPALLLSHLCLTLMALTLLKPLNAPPPPGNLACLGTFQISLFTPASLTCTSFCHLREALPDHTHMQTELFPLLSHNVAFPIL